MKRIAAGFIVLLLMVSASAWAGDWDVTPPTKDEQTAINIVKAAKLVGGAPDMTLGDYFENVWPASEMLCKNDYTALGWTCGEREGRLYTVMYSYKENGQFKKAEWRVDLNKKTVKAADNIAKKISAQ
jgi:hypothetical protein